MSGVLAVSVTRSSVRRRVYLAPNRNAALNGLFEVGGSGSAADANGSSGAYMLLLEQSKLVKRAGFITTGKPGRPPVKWALTDKGRKRVRRARGEIK